MGPTVLSDALAGLTAPDDPDLLVGYETSDDAAVYRLSDELAMVNTVDFITPPVDDPLWFGRIAAANSLSDVYAMGGRPLTALNLVMFPGKVLGVDVLREILRGGREKTDEAGACLVGGHSVDDLEPKYGLSVSGVVHPDRIWTNAGAGPGDALILTKALGSGVLFNAARAGKVSLEFLAAEVLPETAGLNRRAAEVAGDFSVRACTDVTGFGLAGHALEMARGGGLRLRVEFGRLPLYSGARDMYARGVTTGSNAGNRLLGRGALSLAAGLAGPDQELLFDPQTSGGLLLAVPEAQAGALVAALQKAGVARAVRIGEFLKGEPGLDVV